MTTSDEVPLPYARPLDPLVRLTLAVALHPCLLLFALHASWLAACLKLGRHPDPPDQNDCGFASDALSLIFAPLYFTTPFIFLAQLTLFAVVMARRPTIDRVSAGLGLLVIAAWLGSALLLGDDPLGAFDWFRD